MNIVFLSLHGLFRSNQLELGRDADNGGQITYVMELGKGLALRPEVDQVTLYTRLIHQPGMGPEYSQPSEAVTPKFSIQRIPFGGPSYLPKEQLWPHLDEFVAEALAHIRRQPVQPDVIHGHYADAAYAGTRIAEALGVPYIHTGHSLGRIKLSRCLADGEELGKALAQYRFVERFQAEEDSLSRSRFVVTSSHQEINTYDEYENSTRARFKTIPPGIDFHRFLPYYHPATSEVRKQASNAVYDRLAKFLIQPDKPMILALCRPDRKKNLETLVHAYGTDPVLQAMANLVIFAGVRHDVREMLPGVQKVLLDLLLLRDKYGLDGRMSLPKTHSWDEVPEIYRLAAARRGVFVNLALTEPFGLTLLEAAASGLPVVATNDGGPSEIVPALGNGLLVAPTDVSEVQVALKRTLSDEALWMRSSHQGVLRVCDLYQWPLHVDRYLRALRDVFS